jgi:hypothetical protein
VHRDSNLRGGPACARSPHRNPRHRQQHGWFGSRIRCVPRRRADANVPRLRERPPNDTRRTCVESSKFHADNQAY